MNDLQVYVLTSDVQNLNEDYVRIFDRPDTGFARPIFMGTQYPDNSWFTRFNKLNRSQAVELYNHYLIWLESIKSGQPIVILYDQSSPTQPDRVISQLIKASQLINGQTDAADIFFYGKYLDQCDQYTYERTVFVDLRFPIYQTKSPHGVFAYMIYPSGAQKLVNNLSNVTVDQLINGMIEKGAMKALTYHPSIIRINSCSPAFKYECREPVQQTSAFWYILIFVLIGLLVGALIYILTHRRSPSNLCATTTPVRVNSIRSPLNSV
jgi:hypothetical protein